ncbi:MAG: 50S ribosomal protein L29 [Candidatus Aenigmarchaeota archaeon]|nr:50S ribosomal protein L29 [Candidatus Aenigmarchaeota archaeon]
MAILKMKKIREMNEKELSEKQRELKLELSKEKAASEIGTVKNPGRIKGLRRTIARMQTLQKVQLEGKKQKPRGAKES